MIHNEMLEEGAAIEGQGSPALRQPTFRQLLDQLDEHHTRELSSLRSTNERLIAELRALEERAEILPPKTDAPAVPVPVALASQPGLLTGQGLEDDEQAEEFSGIVASPVSSEDDRMPISRNLTNTFKDLRTKFELKPAWIDVPTCAGVWGQEIDALVAEHNICNMVKALNQDSIRSLNGKISRISSFVIHPGSNLRMSWDAFGMLMIGFDVVYTPLLVFELPESAFTIAMAWAALFFWTADMFLSCCTGYFENGDLIMDRSQITLKYLRFWFWIDALVVVPDWIMTFMQSASNVAGLGRLLRFARALRVLRLSRVLKMQRFANAVADMIDSETMSIAMNLAKMLLYLLVMNHFIACAWYLIGKLSNDWGFQSNWLEDSGETPILGDDIGWAYTTSLHWSIALFTPGSMDIVATNTFERAFSIFVLFFALVAQSSIIGSVSASLSALRLLNKDLQNQLWTLQRYLRQCKIPKQLLHRIMKYAEHHSTAKRALIPASKVTLLGYVSEQLKLELSNEVHSPVLVHHLFFEMLSTSMPVMMFKICDRAVSTAAYACSDVAFHNGDEATHFYFVNGGMWSYGTSGRILPAKSFLSEAVLWTSWRHRGDLVAMSDLNELTLVMPGPFGDLLRLHPKPWGFAQAYAQEFVGFLNGLSECNYSDVLFNDDFFDRIRGFVLD